MAFSTYSFAQINATIQPVGYGSASTNGNGIGQIDISYANDNTTHDLAADGSVMVSKIQANNGTIAIQCQQTSALHEYFLSLFNYLNNAGASVWAGTTITLSSPSGLQSYIVAQGVSFQKRADQPFQQQGQMVTWNFMAADIQYPMGGNRLRLI